MPNRVSVGQIYTAERAMAGTSARGDWEMAAVRDGKKNTEIVIWIDNRPSNLTKGDRFRINKISEVSFGWKKDNFNGKETWVPTVGVNAEVVRISGDFDGLPEDLPDDFGGVAPWEEVPEDDQLPL